MSERPLAGVKVVELATFVAVPGAARALADMGAEVIKVETPMGDNLRYTAKNEGRPEGHEENTSFDLDNAGKKGIVIDLKAPGGREVLFQLLEDADVFLTNLRDKALVKLGIDYEAMHTRLPGLVYGVITGYGDTGPDKDLPGYDFTAYFARGGWTGALYEPGSQPMIPIPGLGDHPSGMYLAAGVCAALYKKARTGQGERVSVSLFHSAVYAVSLMLTSAQYGKPDATYPQPRSANANPLTTAYKTGDERFIQIALPPYNQMYNHFMQTIGREDLVDHPVYKTQQTADGHMHEVYNIVAEAMLSRTKDEWVAAFQAADIPHAVAQTWEELLVDEQAWATDIFYSYHYPTGNDRTLVRNPVRFAESALPEVARGPYLGENTREVLAGHGYSDQEIAALHEQGVVKSWEE